MNITIRDIPEGKFREFWECNINDKVAIILFIMFMINYAIDGVFRRIFSGMNNGPMYQWGLENLLFLMPIAFLLISRYKSKMTVWPVYFVFFLFIGLSWLIFPEYEEWYNHNLYGWTHIFNFSSAVAGLLIISLFKDAKKLLLAVIFSSRTLFGVCLLQMVVAYFAGGFSRANHLGKTVMANYSLGLGYNIAFCASVFLFLYFVNRKKSDLFLVITAAVAILAMGSRGAFIPLVCVVILLPVFFWRYMRFNGPLTVFVFAVLIGSFTCMYIYSYEIINFVADMLYTHNISSRTLEMLASERITNMTGRSFIYSLALDLINESPILGSGFYGDRYVIGRYIFWGYPHNIFLELGITYGVPLALFMILFFLYKLTIMLKRCDDVSYRIVLFIFCVNCAKLVLSDSYVYSKFFWMMLGVIGLWFHERKRLRRQARLTV